MILDTNAYSALARNAPSIVDSINQARQVALPLPVIAELRYGFAMGNQPDRNEALLERFLAQPQASVLSPSINTTWHYAKLQKYCRQQGRALSNNDIWIAALAQEAADTLATYDADFKIFADLFGDKLLLLA